MTLTGVRASFCASHYNDAAELHGHSYLVWAWFGGNPDAIAAQSRLASLVRAIDHQLLEHELRSGEGIAEWVGTSLGAQKVRVERPIEGIAAEWTRD